jgi:hypothetical protein
MLERDEEGEGIGYKGADGEAEDKCRRPVCQGFRTGAGWGRRSGGKKNAADGPPLPAPTLTQGASLESAL